jgi:peroxiredoxin Q/BCP
MANHSTRLKAGEQAPDFKANDQTGKEVRLSDFKGKKVVLYFYPKDDTPTCTNQACNLRDNHALLKKKGYVVLGVSADDEKKHVKFTKKYDLPFQLLADVDKKIIHAYDVWGEKLFMGRLFDGIVRTTFIIDEKGIIERVLTDVKSKTHAEQILLHPPPAFIVALA